MSSNRSYQRNKSALSRQIQQYNNSNVEKPYFVNSNVESNANSNANQNVHQRSTSRNRATHHIYYNNNNNHHQNKSNVDSNSHPRSTSRNRSGKKSYQFDYNNNVYSHDAIEMQKLTYFNNNYHDPQSNNNYHDPQSNNNYHDPQSNNNYHDPQSNNNYHDSQDDENCDEIEQYLDKFIDESDESIDESIDKFIDKSIDESIDELTNINNYFSSGINDNLIVNYHTLKEIEKLEKEGNCSIKINNMNIVDIWFSSHKKCNRCQGHRIKIVNHEIRVCQENQKNQQN